MPVYTSAAPVLDYSVAQRQVKGEVCFDSLMDDVLILDYAPYSLVDLPAMVAKGV